MDLNPEKEITVPANNSLKTSVWVNGKDTRCFSGQCIEEFKLPTINGGEIVLEPEKVSRHASFV